MVPELPVASVPAELVTAEVPTGLAVDQVTNELQLEAPLAIVQEGVEIVPDIDPEQVKLLPYV